MIISQPNLRWRSSGVCARSGFVHNYCTTSLWLVSQMGILLVTLTFADDTQLHDSVSPEDYNHLVRTLQTCTSEVKACTLNNKLKLNRWQNRRHSVFEMSIIFIALLSVSLLSSITPGLSNIDFVDKEHNLGFILDRDRHDATVLVDWA